MTRLCCVGCQGQSFSLGSRDHVITDANGRRWTFEHHPYLGPIVLRQDGDPKARQPGSRSNFWPAYQAWRDTQG